ncbi:MAG: hypothetical protein H7A35_11125 [Planctomycetales bacterium]|nr:hypothetical protein [bacterium]UNM07417.1 MAG: hypothetical protein H7A35_11125 [Planctomycetales bacterium]
MRQRAHRLIDYLLDNSLAPDERTARGLIMRGDVLVDERPQTSPAFPLPEDCIVRIRGRVDQPVSRGYDKLGPVADGLSLEMEGKLAMDLGVSTGGFSQYLLDRGVARLYAVDVAYGVVADSVRNDSRVVLLERTNARELSPEHVPEPVDIVVGDLSFIGWSAVLPAIKPLLAQDAKLLLLVKPQFELAARRMDNGLQDGIVASAELRLRALELLWDTWHNVSLCPRAVIPSALKGQKGNQEYFVLLENGISMCTAEEYLEMARMATGSER